MLVHLYLSKRHLFLVTALQLLHNFYISSVEIEKKKRLLNKANVTFH